MKTKLTDSYGNDLLNEEGQVQYVENNQLNNIDKETVYYALSRLLDDDLSDDEFNYISDLRDKFSVDQEALKAEYKEEGFKACAICTAYFKPLKGAKLTETRHLCPACRKAGA